MAVDCGEVPVISPHPVERVSGNLLQLRLNSASLGWRLLGACVRGLPGEKQSQ